MMTRTNKSLQLPGIHGRGEARGVTRTSGTVPKVLATTLVIAALSFLSLLLFLWHPAVPRDQSHTDQRPESQEAQALPEKECFSGELAFEHQPLTPACFYHQHARHLLDSMRVAAGAGAGAGIQQAPPDSVHSREEEIIHFTHVINPFPAQDAQFMWTIDALLAAKAKAKEEKNINVEILAIAFPSEASRMTLPAEIRVLPWLCEQRRAHHVTEAILGELEQGEKRLYSPIVKDMWHLGFREGRGLYFVFTNFDINIRPSFYIDVYNMYQEMPRLGSLDIFRRQVLVPVSEDISSWSVHDLMAWGNLKDHPGHDCFVIPRQWVPCVPLNDFLLGTAYWGTTVAASLSVMSRSLGMVHKVLPRSGLTRHLGSRHATADFHSSGPSYDWTQNRGQQLLLNRKTRDTIMRQIGRSRASLNTIKEASLVKTVTPEAWAFLEHLLPTSCRPSRFHVASRHTGAEVNAFIIPRSPLSSGISPGVDIVAIPEQCWSLYLDRGCPEEKRNSSGRQAFDTDEIQTQGQQPKIALLVQPGLNSRQFKTLLEVSLAVSVEVVTPSSSSSSSSAAAVLSANRRGVASDGRQRVTAPVVAVVVVVADPLMNGTVATVLHRASSAEEKASFYATTLEPFMDAVRLLFAPVPGSQQSQALLVVDGTALVRDEPLRLRVVEHLSGRLRHDDINPPNGDQGLRSACAPIIAQLPDKEESFQRWLRLPVPLGVLRQYIPADSPPSLLTKSPRTLLEVPRIEALQAVIDKNVGDFVEKKKRMSANANKGHVASNVTMCSLLSLWEKAFEHASALFPFRFHRAYQTSFAYWRCDSSGLPQEQHPSSPS